MDPTKLFQALWHKTRFQVVGTPTVSATQLRFIGRLPRNLGIQQWLVLMDTMYERHETASWKVDISKSYFKRTTDRRLVYAWRFIFQGERLGDRLDEIVATINGVPLAARQEVMEMPLVGASPDRNNPSANGRGAGGVFNTPTGPAAIQRRNMGG